ncbi:VaFE repeat-containing surface-anchored protein [Candidatus Enterococcus ferrettii]|uniref:T-Q ester bond containing domain-containing protein n=1 Tax=Candidatus Enterococcus ferrettii TaxID=2815324 RepID=A0ABV0EZJ6_9ENTE|nr:VaFE repeat-containing surface-anchored protein [Enterococcus sp. 665A]MBO1340273.1 VaFE repeat-containing surface-anchored protein [Enterococcus sp. 665A]
MNKLKKIMVSLMLLFTLSGQIAAPVQAVSTMEKTEVSHSSDSQQETQNSEQAPETQSAERSKELPKKESSKEDNQETGESQNSNDSPNLEEPEKVEAQNDVNEQLASVLKEYGYYMTTDGRFLSSTAESVRDNWTEFLEKVQGLRSENQLARQALSIVSFAGTTVYVDQNYSIPTASWDYSNGIHDQGYYAKRDANGGMLWCVAPGNPLNFGPNDGFTPEERNQQNLVIASLIAYWGYETQPSVENAFYTERHIQNMGAGVESGNIQDPSGRVSQAGFNAWIQETNRKINSYLVKPSFDSKSYTMKKGETLRVDDTNSSLWAYKVAANNTNMDVSIDGNTLVIKATGDVNDGTVRLKYNISPSYEGASLIYRHPYSQEVLKAGIKDPNYTDVNVNVQKEGKIKIKKVDDTNKNLEGAEFKLTIDGKTSVVKTNANGELETPNYNVGTTGTYEETKALPGHYLDSSTSKGSFTIKEGTTTIKVTNPRYANLTLIKKNDAGVNMEGVTFKLMYDGKTETVKTNKDGQIKVVNTLKAGTKVDWEETATIAGHYIDPATAKGSITVKSGENTINVKNPRYADLVLHKVNDKGEDMEGVVFKFKVGDQEFEKTTDGKGNIAFKNEFKSGSVVEYEEIKTLKGHYIDPATAKGSITVKSGDNAIEVKNPCLDFLISSQATNKDGAKFVNPAKGQDLKDEVKIEAKSAPVGAKLRLTSNFVEFGTGKALSEQDMKTVEEFEIPEGHSTFVHTINNEFDATNLNGKKGVYTQILDYFNPSTNEWEEVARADDVNDENEAIQIVEPKVKTKLFFYDHKENEVKLTDPLSKVKGYDLVEYENLISGETYTFDLTMMVPSGEKFVDPLGKEVKGQIVIVAGVDGEITSTMDAQEYYNKKAKEDADKDTDKEGEKDTDKEVPKETDQKDNKEADKTPDKDTGKDTDKEGQEPQEVQTDFSDVKPVTLVNGSVKVPFEINLSEMAGKAVVAYEVLSTNDTPVTDHKDPNNKDQTGHIRNPKLNTKALVNGKKEITEDGKLVLEDEVEYFDLTPGVEYEQDLVWMVKNTGEALKLKEKEVTGTIKFTPENESGKVTVKVEINGNDLFEKYGDLVDLVAFETTKRDGEVITEHKNINDIGQTVRIIRPATPVVPKTVKTLPQTGGTLGNSATWIFLALVLVTGAIFVFIAKNKNKEESQ